MSIERSGRIADELDAALTTMSDRARSRCEHATLAPSSCGWCHARIEALAALDRTAEAASGVEVAIEALLTAMDAVRRTAQAERDESAFSDAERAASLAEARYRVWLHDTHSADAL